MRSISPVRRDPRRRFISLLASSTVGYLLIGHTGLAFSQRSDEKVWQQFVQWLPTAPPSDSPAFLFGLYRARLVATGTSEAEADDQIAVIREMMRTRTDGRRVMFNNIYSSPTQGFNTNPNALLVSAIEGRKPGRALDVGMGQGRNAVFLAQKGWDVTGFDISDEGLNVARKNAERVGVKVNALLQSRDKFDFGTVRWDLIVITYEAVPLTTARYVKRLSDSLRPGGLIVIESLASDSAAKGRGPADIDPAELKRAFAGFRILHFEDTVAKPDWGKDPSRLARLIAEKKN